MENFLSHMITEITQQRQVLEVECGLLKDLLKPWPTKKKVLDDSDNKKTAITQELPKVADNVSNEEKQALSQVDKLLQKAEKARRFRVKIKQDVEEDTPDIEVCSIKKIDVKSTNKPESSDCTVPNDSLTHSTTSDVKENVQKATSHCMSLPKINNSSKQTSEYQSSHPRNRTVKQQLTTSNKNCSASKEVSKEDSRQKTHIPPSSIKPSSGKNRHVPAHALAPFKTHENLKFPKHRKSNLPNHTISKRNITKTPTHEEITTNKTLPDIASTESERLDKPSDMCIDSFSQMHNSNISNNDNEISPTSHFVSNKSNFSTEELPADPLPAPILTGGSNTNYCSISNCKSACDNSTKCLNVNSHSATMNQQNQTKLETNSDVSESELQQFSLRENGSSIKLPGKLVKLVNINRSLRNRLSPSVQLKNAPRTDPAKQFVERLCAEEEISKELSIHTSALTCLKSHQILLDIVQGLYLDQLSEDSSMETLYRAKRTLEFVLATFSDLQDDADYFSQVKYRQSPLNLQKTQNKDPKTSLWFDIMQRKGCEDDLWNHLQTSKRWAYLYFTKKYLQMNITLVKTAQAEWWKILPSLDRSPTVLQGVYGLLTSHGQFLPAMVENPDLA